MEWDDFGFQEAEDAREDFITFSRRPKPAATQRRRPPRRHFFIDMKATAEYADGWHIWPVEGRRMSLHALAVESLIRARKIERCCKFVGELSLYEFHALFYRDPSFQQWILDHARFIDGCGACAKKIEHCHPIAADQQFRKQAERYLRSGQSKFSAFLLLAE